MNAARYAGENAGNIIEIENMLSFLQSSGIIDFDAPFAKQSDPQSFHDYPSIDKTKPQLWSPFQAFDIVLGSTSRQTKLHINSALNICTLAISLLHYIGRIKCQTQSNTAFSSAELLYPIKCSGRMVCALSIHIYSICICLVLIMPSSQFVDNSRISKSQECWYVVKVLTFFNFKIDDRPESFYIL
ncbi:hypothetical protein BDF20DRAFT_883801, partial [Mycotypha africana]|uniref:uncharacterized protein n=1 Tax=Mycotypha africana TaxID=64632 RepID=UPI002300AB9D